MRGSLTRPTRRALLAGAVALPALGRAAWSAAETPPKVLRAAPAHAQIAPDGYARTDVWAYNGTVPGEMLHYLQGDTLSVRLENALEVDTTIHWHGLRLPNGMDGVPGITQPPVRPGETFDYAFPLPDAGTFWYHPHTSSAEQVSRGLAGVLVVDEPEPPEVDRDEVIVLDDWRMTPKAQIHDSFGSGHDRSHAGRIGNFVTANARGELSLEAQVGQRWRLRLVNTATARIFTLRFRGLKVWQAALDGMPLAAPEAVDQVVLGPAQRVDLIAHIAAGAGEEALIASVERQGSFALVSFAVSGPRSVARPSPAALPPNPMPDLALAGARSAPLVMEGGAMRGLPEGASWRGSRMDMRALAQNGQFWAFNAVAGMSEAPFAEAARGETIRVPMANRTAFPHAMHLHGTHFREIAGDGSPGPWRDTLLLGPDETREIAFVAERAGDWMFHCHMLGHQVSGMMTWIRVS